MATVVDTKEELRDTDGFLVESADGDVGWVEEIWLDEQDEPRALAMQTVDGRHALLLAEDVLTVDREQHWVVVPAGQELLELEAPRLAGDGRGGGRVAASWSTTGNVLPAPSRPRWRWPHVTRHPHSHPRVAALGRRIRRWPAWVAVAVLYGTLALIATSLIALAFVIARLLTGSAY